MNITGKTLIDWGHKPGQWFPDAVKAAKAVIVNGGNEAEARAAAERFAPAPAIGLRASGELRYSVNMAPDGDDEIDNIAKVEAHMAELMRVPTIVAGAIMPDACPSDYRPGTIPVGGIVAAKEAIHPGMHSADICCSMAVTIFGPGADPTSILDAGMKMSHFGGGGRQRGSQVKPDAALLERFAANEFLSQIISDAIEHHATQGDGNHFFYVGRVASSGATAFVPAPGSGAPGPRLFNPGMAAAEKFRRQRSPETGAHNAWIPSETREGARYWEALQIVREWTKSNHYAIHDMIADALGLKRADRFWNEHNFVFRKSDGLFYHAKGATPAYRDFAADTAGLTLIPLNMAEPILITRGLDAPNGLGFSPHGAGRNFSRTQYVKRNAGKIDADMIAEQAPGIDVRYFCGIPDVSELPLAYKNAASMRAQIDGYGLAEVIDTIDPIGNIMAGDWQRDAPWRKKSPHPHRPAARGCDMSERAGLAEPTAVQCSSGLLRGLIERHRQWCAVHLRIAGRNLYRAENLWNIAMTRPLLIAALLALSGPAGAGDISPTGTSIEVENYRCTVTSPRTLECQNIGRVCEAQRAADEIERKKDFGCALRSPPDCPPTPDYDRRGRTRYRRK